ncbi:hypothetical protein EYB53_003825 [Candidatus Chloroploca sp. M-50]|uniref:Uncharacterized protein n=1 Tax=Candidatus Chloroploca mongolica TaxID=2528176 RepID=A0ABS4D5W9_9CHLR|nr:hypothetical protein [Candidatus Chloroploca mongolica]MBP1464832.1 hypothetical protein [Candidatus Chloroploca mongolica]
MALFFMLVVMAATLALLMFISFTSLQREPVLLPIERSPRHVRRRDM